MGVTSRVSRAPGALQAAPYSVLGRVRSRRYERSASLPGLLFAASDARSTREVTANGNRRCRDERLKERVVEMATVPRRVVKGGRRLWSRRSW